MSRLLILRRVRFSKLQRLTGLSGGNLASHLEVLRGAGFVDLRHGVFEKALGKYAALTTRGESAFRAYMGQLETLLESIRSGLREMTAAVRASPQGAGSAEYPDGEASP